MSFWVNIQKEARDIILKDPFIEPILQAIILDSSTFGYAISKLLSKEFAGMISEVKWHTLFEFIYENGYLYHSGMGNLETMGTVDLLAIRERDPASDGLVNPFLHFKGYKAVQAHRIAHVLWHMGRKETARAIQSRCSELYAVDIHPAAIIGEGLMMDHGTGIVVGETAVIGRNCTFLHGVTLGSTGKDSGDRHPKLGHDILVGCNTTILGNITIGDCCKIGSGSIVVKSLPACATAVGNPARIVGRSLCESASQGMDVALKYVITCEGKSYESTWGDDEKELQSINSSLL